MGISWEGDVICSGRGQDTVSRECFFKKVIFKLNSGRQDSRISEWKRLWDGSLVGRKV